jgi:hypothetical protein
VIKQGVNQLKLFKLTAALGALTFAAWAGPAHAVENVTPYLPGNSVGTPSGATPPPGVYGVDSIDFLSGPIVDNNGNNIPGLKVQSAIDIPVLIWVPNFKLLGASYNVALIQPFSQQSLEIGGGSPGGAASYNQYGIFNTIIVPANLSWMVAPDLFVSAGLGIYLPDGTYADHTTTIKGVVGRQITGTSIANNTWDFEPDVAISYLGGGWNLTGKALFDVQTVNPSTNYQSGTVFFFDWTAAHKFGKWEAGVGGEVAQQINNDTGFGAPSDGNKYSLVLLGPVASYDFGPVTLQGKLLLPVDADNGGKITEFFMTAIWGF